MRALLMAKYMFGVIVNMEYLVMDWDMKRYQYESIRSFEQKVLLSRDKDQQLSNIWSTVL